MNKRNFIVVILVFFSKIFTVKSSDNPEEDGRFFVKEGHLFNKEYLKLVKEYLKENKNERFYLFPVIYFPLLYEKVPKVGGGEETKREQKNIYRGKFTIDDNKKIGKNSNVNYTFAIIKDNYKESTKDCGYINIVNYNIDINEGISLDEKKFKINGNLFEYYKNSENDRPIIFRITYYDDISKKDIDLLFFCSNIDFTWLYNEKQVKVKKNIAEISLFKNEKIKKFQIYEYFFTKNDKGYECDYLFYDCSNLKEIGLDTKDKEIVLYGKSMFSKCTNLEKIRMEKIHNDNPNGNEFTDCTSLKELTLNSKFNLGVSGFRNCKNLKLIKFVDDDGDVYNDHIEVGEKCFMNCENLENIEINEIIINSFTNDLYFNCKKLKKIPKTSIIFDDREEDYYFNDMFNGVSGENNDEINIQFNRQSEKDALPEFDYDVVFNGCDVKKKNIILKELDEGKKIGEKKILEDIKKEDKIKWFLCFPDHYIKLRDLYQKTSDPTLLTFLNSKFESNQSKEEIEKEYNEFIKQQLENNKVTDQTTEEVNVDKNLGKCGNCGLIFTKCCCY